MTGVTWPSATQDLRTHGPEWRSSMRPGRSGSAVPVERSWGYLDGLAPDHVIAPSGRCRHQSQYYGPPIPAPFRPLGRSETPR